MTAVPLRTSPATALAVSRTLPPADAQDHVSIQLTRRPRRAGRWLSGPGSALVRTWPRALDPEADASHPGVAAAALA